MGGGPQQGEGRLYVNYVNKVCRWVKQQGRIPVVWDDMLSAYALTAGTLERLDKEAVIMYWDYWAAGDKSPLLVPRPAYSRLAKIYPAKPYGIVRDRKWDSVWKKLAVDRDKFGLEGIFPIDMKKDLGEKFLKVFGKYLGPEFPKYVKSFPYLGYYRDKGFSVIGAPSALAGWNFNYDRSIANIAGFARRCGQERTGGIMTTSWFSNHPPEILYAGLVTTAAFAWNTGEKE
jgi:hypothetical protein